MDYALTWEQCRQARRALGLTQQQLAKEAGVSRSQISNFEGGFFSPTERMLRKLRDLFDAKGYDFGRDDNDDGAPAVDAPSGSKIRQAPPRATGEYERRLANGQFCVSADLADDKRDKLLARIDVIRDRLGELADEATVAGLIDPYDERTDRKIAEARALVENLGVLFTIVFGFGFVAVPTADLLNKKARANTIADALGLQYAKVFDDVGIRRNKPRDQAQSMESASADAS